jgi:hypothetical protein
VRKREEFRQRSAEAIELTERERKEFEEKNRKAAALGLPTPSPRGTNPARRAILDHEDRYPLERMREIESQRASDRAAAEAAAQAALTAPRYSVQAAVFGTEAAAATILTQLVDAGYDGFIVSGESDGALLFQVVLGPYDTPEQAREVAAAVRAGFGLAPSVLMGEPLAFGNGNGNGSGAPDQAPEQGPEPDDEDDTGAEPPELPAP